MIHADAIAWAAGSLLLTALEPDPSLPGFVRNAGVVGSVLAAGWLVEARIGKKIRGAIEQHAAVEEQRMETMKTAFGGELKVLLTEIKGITDKLDARPCALHAKCRHRED